MNQFRYSVSKHSVMTHLCVMATSLLIRVNFLHEGYLSYIVNLLPQKINKYNSDCTILVQSV